MNGWKWSEMVGSGRKWMEMVGNGILLMVIGLSHLLTTSGLVLKKSKSYFPYVILVSPQSQFGLDLDLGLLWVWV